MPKNSKAPSLALRDLSRTSFSAAVLTNAFNVGVELSDATPVRVEASYSRDPDEHEFYLLRVGHALAQILALCDQLEDIPAYIKHARVTKALRSAGIHRHDLLVYHLENYFVRCQGLYDRTLTLVDAVFHLLNAPSQMKDFVVLGNLKVDRTDVPKRIKVLGKLLQRYRTVRNEVAHQRTLQTDEIRRLEMYGILIAAREQKSDPPDFRHTTLEEIHREEEAWIVFSKVKEFAAFNRNLSDAMHGLLEELAPHYTTQEMRLRHVLEKP